MRKLRPKSQGVEGGGMLVCPECLCDCNSNKSLDAMKNFVMKNHVGISFRPTLLSYSLRSMRIGKIRIGFSERESMT